MKKKDDTRLRDTRLLLHAMGSGLREHIEQSVATVEELESLETLALMRDRAPDVQASAIIRSKTLTEILLVNAETLFKAWKESSGSRDHGRRVQIIHERYFRKQKISDIAQRFKRSEETILNQLGVALNELSLYFFGKDGLNQKSGDAAKRRTSKVLVEGA